MTTGERHVGDMYSIAVMSTKLALSPYWVSATMPILNSAILIIFSSEI